MPLCRVAPVPCPASPLNWSPVDDPPRTEPRTQAHGDALGRNARQPAIPAAEADVDRPRHQPRRPRDRPPVEVRPALHGHASHACVLNHDHVARAHSPRSALSAALVVDLGTLHLTSEVTPPQTKAYFRNLEGKHLNDAQMQELRYVAPRAEGASSATAHPAGRRIERTTHPAGDRGDASSGPRIQRAMQPHQPAHLSYPSHLTYPPTRPPVFPFLFRPPAHPPTRLPLHFHPPPTRPPVFP